MLLFLLAGLIVAVTTAPAPSPDPHHGGSHALDEGEQEELEWVSEARMRKKPMNKKSSTTRTTNMSRKKSNMRKQENMMKKANLNDKSRTKSNMKKRRNTNRRKQQTSSKSSSSQKQSFASFAERLKVLRAQQRKEADAQRKRERDEYLALLKETGELGADDKLIYEKPEEEFNPFKAEQQEQQKLLRQQAVPLNLETAVLEDDYNPFDAEDDSQYEKYTREQVEKEQKRIEAERKERIRERLRDREALQWNRRNKNQAQERMDTGGGGSDYHRQFSFIKNLNLRERNQRREEQVKKAQKMNPLNPKFKARQQSYVAAWRSKMRMSMS